MDKSVKTQETNEMLMLQDYNKKLSEAQSKDNFGGVIAGSGSSESKLEEGEHDGVMLGGVRPFRTISVTGKDGNIYVLALAKFSVDGVIDEGTIDLDEWQTDIENGVGFENQEVVITTKEINGTLRNAITRD
jgi:hypothetical protein